MEELQELDMDQMVVQSIKHKYDQLWSMKEESLTAVNSSMIKSEMLGQGPAVPDLDVKKEPMCWEDSVAGDASDANGNEVRSRETNEEERIESSICIEKQELCWDEKGQIIVCASEQQEVGVKDKDEKFSPRSTGELKYEENLVQNIVKPEFVSADRVPWDLEAVELVSVDPLAGCGHKCNSCSLIFSSPVYLITHQKFCCDTKEGILKIRNSEEASIAPLVFEKTTAGRGRRVVPENKELFLRGATGEHRSGEQGKGPSVEDRELPSSDEGDAVEERTAGEISVEKGCSDIVPADSLKCGELPGSEDEKEPRSENTYECNVCGKKLPVRRINYLKSHMGRKSCACPFCGATFLFNSLVTRNKRTLTSEVPYACTLCEARFSEEGHLKAHTRVHTGKKPFACELCKAKFTDKSSLKVHTREHTGEKSFACTLCKARFGHKNSLKIHTRVHTGEKPYACTLCEARFSEKAYLKKHTRVHTGEKPFACTLCKARFARKCSLKIHIRVHTGERPYACTLCEARFSEKGHLNAHSRLHTGIKPFACTLCKARFAHKNSLKIHTRVHTGERPYACTLCEARFSEKGHLRGHIRVHTGEKSFACTLCKARFAYKSSLKIHTRVHTGERPYACTLCESRFSQKYSLKKHIRVHTGEKAFAEFESVMIKIDPFHGE